MTETKKVLITGAAGQIGYALSFNVARGDLGNFQVKLFLLDIEQCNEKLDIEQCTDSKYGISRKWK